MDGYVTEWLFVLAPRMARVSRSRVSLLVEDCVVVSPAMMSGQKG